MKMMTTAEVELADFQHVADTAAIGGASAMSSMPKLREILHRALFSA